MRSEDRRTFFRRIITQDLLDEDKKSNSSHNDGKTMDPDGISSKRKDYLICIDPITYSEYRLDLENMDIIVDDAKCPEEIVKKIKQHYGIISRMLNMPNFHWIYERSYEVNRYRKRVFPYRKFLCEEASDYPVYVYQSELSKAFSKKVELDVEVDLMEYKDAFQGHDQNYVIKLKENLVTSFNEVLKNLRRRVFKDYGVKLKPSADHQFVLKADGYRDYLRGNDSLLAYERVRIVLRKREILKLILTEIPKRTQKQIFPPVLKLSQNEKIDFTEIAETSPLFWYPYHSISANPETPLKTTQQRDIMHVGAGRLIKFIRKKQQMNFANSERVLNTDPATILEHLSVIKSGHCNFRFRFKIMGIENVGLIFNELTEPVATDNGRAKPGNLTLPTPKSMNLSMNGDGMPVKVPSIYNDAKMKEKVKTKLPFSSPFSTHLTYSPIFEEYCQEKKFPFVPYALYLKVKIYYGCQKLSKPKFTRKVPFNTTATFNEWIEFSDVRVFLYVLIKFE